MATIADALSIAVDHHRAGRLREAEEIYRQILAAEPNHSDALHLLGAVSSQVGEFEFAVDQIRRAIQINPADSAFHSNLGNALTGLKNWPDAVTAYRRAISLQPDFAEAHANMGKALHEQGKLDEAVSAYRRALELKPDFAEAYNDLGRTRGAQGQQEEAAACYRRALEINREYAEAHNNLGTTFEVDGNLNDAMACYRRALELKSNYPEAHNNMGVALRQLGRLEEAICEHGHALTCDPANADAHYYRGMLLLLQGNYERGWEECGWRWKNHQLVKRAFAKPLWNREPLESRSALLHSRLEQGFGDTIQFIRYAKVIKQENPNAMVIVECQRPLTKLLARCLGFDRLVAEGDELPAFDVHVPLLSLPGILGTHLETIPGEVPYLFADEGLVRKWGERLEKVEAARKAQRPHPNPLPEEEGTASRTENANRMIRIGINWQGRAGQGEFRKRDVPLECFAALGKLPGVRLFSLQKGADRNELTKTGVWDPGDDWDTTAGAFIDTAAIMKNLDLVISSDTAVPHLAGALGVPVWVALPYMPDWRWLLKRNDSPWYPTMRLFRQKNPGDWAGVFEEIEAALRERIGR